MSRTLPQPSGTASRGEYRTGLRQIVRGLRATYLPEKRASDLAMGVVVWAVYRPLSFVVSAVLIQVGVSANQVTYCRYVAVVGECIAFIWGTHAGMIAGGVCHFSHYFLDFVDGNIARYHHCPTRYGALLDGMVDRLGYILPPLAIGIGLFRRPDQFLLSLPLAIPSWLPLLLGATASLGTVLLLTWDVRRWWEFLGLAHATGAAPYVSVIQVATTTGRHAKSRPRGIGVRILEATFSNVAHVLETAIVVLAVYDIIGLFLGFRFMYYLASRGWLAAEWVLTSTPSER